MSNGVFIIQTGKLLHFLTLDLCRWMLDVWTPFLNYFTVYLKIHLEWPYFIVIGLLVIMVFSETHLSLAISLTKDRGVHYFEAREIRDNFTNVCGDDGLVFHVPVPVSDSSLRCLANIYSFFFTTFWIICHVTNRRNGGRHFLVRRSRSLEKNEWKKWMNLSSNITFLCFFFR